MAEQWYAPGFPPLTDPRMSLQPSLPAFPTTVPCSKARKVPPPAPPDNSHSSPQHYASPQTLSGPLWQLLHLLQCMVLQTSIAPALLSCFPTDNCAVNILEVVLLSLVLAPEMVLLVHLLAFCTERQAGTRR